MSLGDGWGHMPPGESDGLVINLGHSGKRCPRNPFDPRSMTIVHEHGVHHFKVGFCRCPRSDPTDPTNPVAPEATQLLEIGFWPGSWVQPRSAFTISVLRQFHLLSVHTQANVHDFFATLKRQTDGVDDEEVSVSMN